MDNPFMRPFDPGIPEIVTDAAVHILASQGVDRFSVRAIARWMRVTPAYLLNDYSRSRLLEIILISFADRWIEWSGADSASGVVGMRLPQTPDELDGVRVRGALEDLADAEWLRLHPAPSFQVASLHARELDQLTATLRSQAPGCCPPSDHEVSAMLALLAGLRGRLAARPPVLDLGAAEHLLDLAIRELGSHQGGCAAAELAS
jgi:AcrR family transcriptional regulator